MLKTLCGRVDTDGVQSILQNKNNESNYIDVNVIDVIIMLVIDENNGRTNISILIHSNRLPKKILETDLSSKELQTASSAFFLCFP